MLHFPPFYSYYFLMKQIVFFCSFAVYLKAACYLLKLGTLFSSVLRTTRRTFKIKVIETIICMCIVMRRVNVIALIVSEILLLRSIHVVYVQNYSSTPDAMI